MKKHLNILIDKISVIFIITIFTLLLPFYIIFDILRDSYFYIRYALFYNSAFIKIKKIYKTTYMELTKW